MRPRSSTEPTPDLDTDPSGAAAQRPAAESVPVTPSTAVPSREARAARAATVAAFVLAGVTFASWASRLPEIRQGLDLSNKRLGLLLLFVAVGSVVALPLAGRVASRLGTARATAAGAVVQTTGLIGAGLAASALGSTVLTAACLLLVGVGTGLWDVAMNLEGAEVERRYQRAIMPSFHAGFSLGTVLAAGLGALAAHLAVPVWVHLTVVGLLVLSCVVAAVRRYLPVEAAADVTAGTAEHEQATAGGATAQGASTAPNGGRVRPRSAWTEPRTLLVGVVVLAAAFTEGTANDWLSVAAVDGYGLSPAGGALALAVFLAAMTAFRLTGQGFLDRYGRVATVRATTVLAAAGALLVVFGGSVPIAAVGAVLWGAGASLGFPVGISAAADDSERAAGRVSVVTTIGYTAFLAGPPLLGFLGDHVGVLHALTVVAIVAVPSFMATRVLRPVADDAAGA